MFAINRANQVGFITVLISNEFKGQVKETNYEVVVWNYAFTNNHCSKIKALKELLETGFEVFKIIQARQGENEAPRTSTTEDNATTN